MRAVAGTLIALAVLTTAGAAASGASSELVVSFNNSEIDALDLSTGARTQLAGSNTSHARYSYDGTKLVYGSGTGLVVADADGRNPVTLSVGAARVADHPSLSPDDRSVVFSGDGGNLYTIGIDGSSLQQITAGPGLDVDPVWSPRGDAIAFTRRSDENRPELYLVGPTGGDRQLTFGGANAYSSAPSWSPDGSWIAFNEETYEGNHVAIIHPDGSGHQQITPNFPRPFGYASPAWSPDGTRIAFTPTPSRIDTIGIDRQNWATAFAGASEINAISWRPVSAGIAVSLAEIPSEIARARFNTQGAVRSIGLAAAEGVVATVEVKGPAVVAAATLGGAPCRVSPPGAQCEVASVPGDTDLPLTVRLVPTRPGHLALAVHVGAQNDTVTSDDDANVTTSVSSCTVLGTHAADRLHARGGDVVCGLQDDDVIFARNGKRDSIDCGPGIDTAYVDRLDVVRHCERVRRGR